MTMLVLRQYQFANRFLPQLLVASQFSSSSSCQSITSHEVELSTQNGLYHLKIPMVSRKEQCLFILKPTAQSVGDLQQFIKQEDAGIKVASMYRPDGVAISKSDLIGNLMATDFDLKVNDDTYRVQVPPQSPTTSESLDNLTDTHKIVQQLHLALNRDQHALEKERELIVEMENVQAKLVPMEKKRLELSALVGARNRRWGWYGLGAMGFQFGFLARLTWWEYSWDVMEPVTYFVGCGTLIVMYGYYVVTKQEYVYEPTFNRIYLRHFHNAANKASFDVEEYNKLRTSLVSLEEDLDRVRDTLRLQLPLQPKSSHLVPKDEDH